LFRSRKIQEIANLIEGKVREKRVDFEDYKLKIIEIVSFLKKSVEHLVNLLLNFQKSNNVDYIFAVLGY